MLKPWVTGENMAGVCPYEYKSTLPVLPLWPFCFCWNTLSWALDPLPALADKVIAGGRLEEPHLEDHVTLAQPRILR